MPSSLHRRPRARATAPRAVHAARPASTASPVVAPGELVEEVVPSKPAVERQQIAQGDVHECAEAAGPGEPREDRQAGQRHAKADGRERASPRRPSARPPRPARERRHEHDRVGLDPHGHAQRQGRAAEPPDLRALGSVDRGHDARGAPGESAAEQQLALPGEPRASGEVVEGKERGRGEATPRPAGAQRDPETGPGDQQKAQVERAKREIPGPEGEEQQEVGRVDAGKVHVEEVPIGHRPVQDPPRDVVHERGVVDERPAAREPREPEGGQPHQEPRPEEPRREPRQPGRWGWRIPRKEVGRASWTPCQNARDTAERGRSVAPPAWRVKRGSGQARRPVRP